MLSGFSEEVFIPENGLAAGWRRDPPGLDGKRFLHQDVKK
jgi:hypothetical protein